MLIFRKRIWIDRFQTFRFYYSNSRFALIDFTFGLIALFVNPYRVCRKFLQKKGLENIYAYGETPYTTYQRIVEQCQIGPKDLWIEMGAGRGKGCFWLAHFVGCKVIGIEWIPHFVKMANWLRRLFKISKVEFECNDIETASFYNATVIYLYGNWPQNLNKISNNVKVITISEPLHGFSIVKQFWVRYPWGRTTAFLQIKTPS